MSTYLSLQGRVYIGERDANGNPINLVSPGNVAALTLALKTDVVEHFETSTGNRSLDQQLIKSKSASCKLTAEEFTKENLALALHGTSSAVTAGTVTAEVVSTAAPTLGNRYLLEHQKVSTVVITDSSVTPATLVSGTNYTLDADFGALTFTLVTGFTAPIKAAYAYAAVTDLGLFTATMPERFVRFEGINTAASNAPVLLELYRVVFDPLKDLSFISNDFQKFELDGKLLLDSTKSTSDALGQFGRITQIG